MSDRKPTVGVVVPVAPDKLPGDIGWSDVATAEVDYVRGENVRLRALLKKWRGMGDRLRDVLQAEGGDMRLIEKLIDLDGVTAEELGRRSISNMRAIPDTAALRRGARRKR